jgi:hypothetical protein
MTPAHDDWRRMGQARDLPRGTALVFKLYEARSATWEHEHCLFCFTKFMDPDFSEAHRRFIEEHEDVLTEGYTTTDEYEKGAGWHWVCPQCVEDFVEEFGLHVAGGPAAHGSGG